jgi:hypothetical protein
LSAIVDFIHIGNEVDCHGLNELARSSVETSKIPLGPVMDKRLRFAMYLFDDPFNDLAIVK